MHFSADHAGIIAAFDALSKMNNNTFDGVTYSVEPSKNLLRQMNELNLGMGAGQPGMQGLQLPMPNVPQGMYNKAQVPSPRGMDPQFRPRPSRDDQLARLYQHQHQQQTMPPQYGNHRAAPPSQLPNGHMHALGSNSGSPRYGGPGQLQGYAAPQMGQQQLQQQYERYPAPPTHVRNNSHDHLQHMLPPSGMSGSGEDYYARSRSQSQLSDPQSSAPSGQSASPRLSAHSATHSRNSSRDVYEYVKPVAVEEYSSSYLIEKPAFDERYGGESSAAGSNNNSNGFEVPLSDDLRPPMLNINANTTMSRPSSYYNSSSMPAGIPSGLEGSRGGANPAARSPYSYGPNGSPHGYGSPHTYGEKQRSPTSGAHVNPAAMAASGASQYDRQLQGQSQGPVNGQYGDRRSIAQGSAALSSNSHSFYSSNGVAAPAGTTRPPQQTHQRRPSGVTDLEIARSHSMSSSGLPTYSTNATTDSEGGFFKSANSSFTEGQHAELSHHHQFAHLGSFGEASIHPASSRDAWTGISDKQSLLNRVVAVPEQQRAVDHGHRLLSASMRKLSMQSVTTVGGEDVDDLVDDDFTFAASLAHDNQSSQGSLFNYTDSNVSSFRTGPSSSAYNLHAAAGVSPSSAAMGLSHLSLESEPHHLQAQGQGQGQYHGFDKQQYSELDTPLHLQNKHLSLGSTATAATTTSATSFSDGSSKASPMSVNASSTDMHENKLEAKRPSPKSRQLAVTHFFKPVGSV